MSHERTLTNCQGMISVEEPGRYWPWMRSKCCSSVLLASSILTLVWSLNPTLRAQDAELRVGGTITYGEYNMPSSLDPITSNNPVTARLGELLFDGLIDFDQQGEIVPGLAERWTISENGLIYTFTLREGTLWHDGQPVAATDVKFTFDVINHPTTTTSLREQLSFVRGVRVMDSRTIRFTLKTQTFNALGRFSFKIIPSHKIFKAYLTREDPFVWAPIGTGPFMFSRISHEGLIELEANPAYFKGRPYLDKIIMRHFIDRDLMTQSLLTGAIDLIPSVQPLDIGKIREAGTCYFKEYNSLSFSFFAFNFLNPHLKQKLVRQALTIACNRDLMLLQFFLGKGKVISGPFAPGSYSYNPAVEPFPYNETQAKRTLKNAGYRDTNNDGIVDKEGIQLKLTLKANIADKAMKSVCVAYQDYLTRIGVECDLQFLERYAWEKAVFVDHNYDLTLASWFFDDAANISTLFQSGNNGPYGDNFISYANPTVDQLIAEFNAALAPETRRAINYKLHEILHDDCPYLYLWTLDKYAAFSNRIRGVEVDAYRFFSFVKNWYLAPEPLSGAAAPQ